MWRFLPPNADLSGALIGHYDYWLVLLSVSLAILAACTALEVVERARRGAKAASRVFWISLGTICLGFGVWAMHFIGMIGFQLPIPIQYDPVLTVVSIVPALIASAIALSVLTFRGNHLPSLLIAGVLIAAGIGAMHYTGMEAMNGQGAVMHYDPIRFAISILVAVVLAITALLVKSRLMQQGRVNRRTRNLMAGGVLGLAVSGMHYVAMTATWFLPGGAQFEPGQPINNAFLEVGIATILIVIVLIVIVSLTINQRLRHVDISSEVIVMPLGILLFAGFLIYVSSIFIKSIKEEVENETRLAFETVLTTTTQALEVWQSQNISSANVWADSVIVRENTIALLEVDDSQESLLASKAQTALRDWFSGIQGHTGYRGYFVIDLTYRNLSSSRDINVGVDNILIEQAEVMESIGAGRAAISYPLKSDVPLPNENGELISGYPTMFVAAPIQDDTGQPVAALLFRIDPMADFSGILNRSRTGSSGETYAIDSTGNMLSESRFDDQLRDVGILSGGQMATLNIKISNPGANLVAGQVSFVEPENRPLTLMASNVTEGIAGFSFAPYLDYRGVPVIGAWSWLDSMNIGIASEQDYSESMQTFFFARNAIVALTALAASILFVLALTLSLARARQLETTQRSSAILDTTLDGILTWDEIGKLESSNSSGQKMFGIRPGDIKERMLEHFIPTLANQSYEDVRAFFNCPEGEPLMFQMETEGHSLSGKKFPMDISVSEIQLPSGERLFTGIMRDISERRRVEAELLSTTTERQKLEDELNVARNIQRNMLPVTFPPFPDRNDIDIFATLKPAREVGGDFYDFFELQDGTIMFTVGDVSGKGIPAALFMALAKTLVHSHGSDILSPGQVLTRVNESLCTGNEENMFVTLFLALIDPKSGHIRYSNGGHNPPLVLTDKGEIVRLDARHGPVVGAIEGLTYGENEHELSQGDTLLMYTDGVTEAMNTDHDLFGEPKLIEILNSLRFESATHIVNTIANEVVIFEEESKSQADDITILAVRLVHDNEDERILVLELTLENRIEEIKRVNTQFNKIAEERGISSSVTQKFNIVFDELLSNIIFYGSGAHDGTKIRMRIEFLESCIKVAISSYGVPFDPLSVKTPDTSTVLEERAAGGLGIHMVRNLVDEFVYYRRTNQNVINLLKNLSQEDKQTG